MNALEDCHRLNLNANMPVTLMNRGLLFLLQGKDAEAQRDFDKCLILSPQLKPDLEKRIAFAKEIRGVKP